MPNFVNIGGTWRRVRDTWVNVNGTWRKVSKTYTNIGGTWRTAMRSSNVDFVNYGGTSSIMRVENDPTWGQSIYLQTTTDGTRTGDVAAFIPYEFSGSFPLDSISIRFVIPPDVYPYGRMYYGVKYTKGNYTTGWRNYALYFELHTYANGYAHVVELRDIGNLTGLWYIPIHLVMPNYYPAGETIKVRILEVSASLRRIFPV
jgi:hypothetical protein